MAQGEQHPREDPGRDARSSTPRQCPAYRKGRARGRDIKGEELLSEFGFRGIEYGNWAAQDERQKSLNLAYEALHDLTETLGVPPKALSLNGRLGIAFGARGSGKALAHYEPGKLVINLTKLRGAGTLAHEWGHALDHYFGELNRPDAYGGKPRGASGWYAKEEYTGKPRKRHERAPEGGWKEVEKYRLEHLRPEMAEAWDNVMRAIFERQKTQAEAVREVELALEKAQNNLQRAEKRRDDMLKAKAERSGLWASNPRAADADLKAFNQWIEESGQVVVGAHQKRLAKLRADEITDFGSVASSYVAPSRRMSSTRSARAGR